MKILHLLASGGTGGIETLCKDISLYSKQENHFLFIWFGGASAEEMIAKNANVRCLNASKKDILGPYNTIKRYIICNDIQIVIVHHASPVMWVYLSMIKMQMKNIKTIIYIHGHLHDVYRENVKKGLFFRRKIFQFAFSRCDRVIAISNLVKNSLINGGYSADKIRVIYNGVNTAKFFHKRRNVDRNRIQLIYVGRLIPQKGVQILLEALSLIELEVRNKISCEIIGEGTYLKELKQLSKILRVEDIVIFRGLQRDIAERMSKADYFIHVPLWEEGFGITLVEAMASGLICIAFGKGAIPEIIDDREDGFLIYEHTSKAIAEKLNDIILNLNYTEELIIRNNAREKSKKFDISYYIEHLNKVYKELLNNEEIKL